MAELKPFSFTYVVYENGDLVGKFLALMSLAPIFLVVSFTTLCLFRRELHTFTFFLGQLLNEVVNLVLKQTLKEGRPSRIAGHRSDYGMPSSHAQFVFFFAVYVILFLYVRVTFKNRMWKHVCALAAIVMACLVAYSRVYLHYHTTVQVLVGAPVGSILAVIWFLFTHFHIAKRYFPVIERWRLSRYLMLRDSSSTENVLWVEYEECMQRRRKGKNQ